VEVQQHNTNTPVVAVVCRRFSSTAEASKNAQGTLTTYIRTFEEVGAALALVALQGLDKASFVLERCDGLLLTGGEDVVFGHPDYYTVDPQSVDVQRDEVEYKLARQAITSGMPVLGICRGMHLLNVVCGGTLADVPQVVHRSDRHLNDWRAGEQYIHDVHLTAGSTLAGAAKGRTVVRVNSHHLRCIERIGTGFVVAARAGDGVIEAIERHEGAFCVGVQWHPECLLEYGDVFALALMTEFVEACRQSRRALCCSNK